MDALATNVLLPETFLLELNVNIEFCYFIRNKIFQIVILLPAKSVLTIFI